MTTLSRFVVVYGQLFNFSFLKFENAGPGHAKIFHDYDRSDPVTKPYCYNLMGHLEVLAEMAGGRNVNVELKAKQWEGAPTTIFDINWE